MHQLSLRPPNPPPLVAPPAKPFVKWVGGKRRVIQDIYHLMPKKWGRYHEPFAGGGALFFSLAAQRIREPNWASISDNNIRLVRTWRAIRDSTDELIRALKDHSEKHSKEHYYATRALDVDAMDDVGVAAWFIYLNKTGFNGLYRVNRKGGFNVPIGRYSNPKICDESNLLRCAEALEGVNLQHASFENVLESAKSGDFAYFDPPYVPLSRTSSFTSYTRDGFTIEDQTKLRDVALELKNRGVKVLLSNSDHPVVRELYSEGFECSAIQVGRAISCAANRRGSVSELLIY